MMIAMMVVYNLHMTWLYNADKTLFYLRPSDDVNDDDMQQTILIKDLFDLR